MFDKFIVQKKKFDKDTLHINSQTKRIDCHLSLFKFRDRDTRQIIFYIPSLELTSYGSDEIKAMEMIRFSIDDYFTYLLNLSAKNLQSELLELKWKKAVLRNKEFSNISIDVSNKLKTFNAVGNKIERVTLIAA